MIPTILIESPYTILVDGEEIAYTLLPISNSTHAFLYFTYVHSTHHIKITGPPSPPVGGVWVPINKFELLVPWISYVSFMVIAATSIVYVKHRKKKQ